METHDYKDLIFTVLALAIVVGLFGYGGYAYLKLDEQHKLLIQKVRRIEANLKATESALVTTEGYNEELAARLKAEVENLAKLGQQVGDITSTVGTLEKLAQTDPELLQKYSKVYFLNEHYVPPQLETIPTEYVFPADRTIQIHDDVWPYLKRLLREADEEGYGLKVASGYRSFQTQASLKSNYKVTYGAGTANQFSADQGYSEHQLGTTVDFTTPNVGAGLTGFDKNPAYGWLQENAHKYGFVLSYPAGNKYYMFEPWHWRFVGVDLASDLHREGKNFYDVDQREIDKYLVKIFD